MGALSSDSTMVSFIRNRLELSRVFIRRDYVDDLYNSKP